MNYTEKQILDKAKQILKDVLGEYFKDENIDEKIIFEKDRPMRGKNTTHPTWIVCVKEPVFEELQFLTISDKSGEPLSWQTSMVSTFGIKKDSGGKYHLS